MIANTPNPPYYAVLFSTLRTRIDEAEYHKTAERMEKLAKLQPGYLGIESAQGKMGITISYWESLEAIKNWKHHAEHAEARKKGKDVWYQKFQLRICKVEHSYGFEK
jgi:heme-degrading monooxygenase HmoA